MALFAASAACGGDDDSGRGDSVFGTMPSGTSDDTSGTSGDGDGDGDPSTTGDGDGDGDGDPSTTGDGDGDGDGDLCAGDGASVWINEFHYDNISTDAGEFVELAGFAGVDLSCYTLLLYNGNNGALYDTYPISGLIPDEGAGAGAFQVLTPGLQNGAPDGIALAYNSGMVVTEFLSYEGAFMALDGPAAGLMSMDMGGTESNNTTNPGFSLQRIGSGAMGGDFAWQVDPQPDSPGLINSGQTIQ
jgi:hypothetical protein